ncbi:SDR family oxidoreductase [Ornithinimicrobium cerasi]|uniref:NADP-dependent 3-hydroxy acid dehydrogenase YdfG n=1 Tax=Ornithinimicrobium cerasi TaxID=2248773 RepID=A0A285VVR9_9MICO|nr:SDR family oxidoreductase [Ornithinimicrobium cerasi]SOC57688.1 NADP-dependent 3-hydroxy acid dehydrogenase YdfG [Ornithinimicrobium cerasi]
MPSVLVTGAGRGIGEAIALRLARAGWTVFAGVRDDPTGEGLRLEGGEITRVLLDITNDAHVAALADHLPGRLDAVVNNAGIGVLGPVEAVSIPDFRRQFEVNVFGQVAVTQAVLPRVRAAGGRIVFISSTGGRAPVPMEGAYCASKFALEAIADVLRVELRPWHVDVSVVQPGPTDTGPWREIQPLFREMEQGMATSHRELYAQHISGMLKLVGTLQSRTVPPDVVARVVEQALTARRPRARYAAGAQARAMVTMNAVLPTRLNDAIGARLLGLR